MSADMTNKNVVRPVDQPWTDRRVAHGFFGKPLDGAWARGGGVFKPEDRAAAAEALSVDKLLFAAQVHGVEVVRAEDHIANAKPPEADALISTTPGLAVGVLTADCAPVLLADDQARAVAAAHAGWRGAAAGVIERTVEALIAAGADRASIGAVVGPTIAAASYEVREDFIETVRAADPQAQAHLQQRNGRWTFDLPGYAAARLARSGVTRVVDMGVDVRARHEDWHSRRANLQTSETAYGSNMAVIAPCG